MTQHRIYYAVRSYPMIGATVFALDVEHDSSRTIPQS